MLELTGRGLPGQISQVGPAVALDASGKPASDAVVGIAAKTDVYLQIERSGGVLFDQGHDFR